MLPSYKSGQTILVSQIRDYQIDDVVVAHMEGREVLKRITDIKDNGSVYLIGDNRNKSSDSREHGWILDRHIVAKVIWPRKKKLK